MKKLFIFIISAMIFNQINTKVMWCQPEHYESVVFWLKYRQQKLAIHILKKHCIEQAPEPNEDTWYIRKVEIPDYLLEESEAKQSGDVSAR